MNKKKHIIFANALYSEPELKSELSKIGVDTSRDNIDSKKSSGDAGRHYTKPLRSHRSQGA